MLYQVSYEVTVSRQYHNFSPHTRLLRTSQSNYLPLSDMQDILIGERVAKRAFGDRVKPRHVYVSEIVEVTLHYATDMFFKELMQIYVKYLTIPNFQRTFFKKSFLHDPVESDLCYHIAPITHS